MTDETGAIRRCVLHGDRAPRCSGHAGSMTDPTLGWGWGGPRRDQRLVQPHPNPSPEGEELRREPVLRGSLARHCEDSACASSCNLGLSRSAIKIPPAP